MLGHSINIPAGHQLKAHALESVVVLQCHHGHRVHALVIKVEISRPGRRVAQEVALVLHQGGKTERKRGEWSARARAAASIW